MGNIVIFEQVWLGLEHLDFYRGGFPAQVVAYLGLLKNNLPVGNFLGCSYLLT